MLRMRGDQDGAIRLFDEALKIDSRACRPIWAAPA
jgi:hypothetical protein